MAERELVLVEWIDSHSMSGWQPLDEIVGNARPVYCRSVGWVAAESEDTLVLVAHVSGERNERVRVFGTGDMSIPIRSIVSRATLHTETPNPAPGAEETTR